MSVLVTGAAGFIGFHIARALLARGRSVVGIDNLDEYYDVALKRARLDILLSDIRFRFEKADIANKTALDHLFADCAFDAVINMAAQAGVRYSLINPHAYIRSNIEGFLNILEACRHHRVGHLLYASSSSVYGGITQMPFSVTQNVDHPLSLYAATKKSNELMAHSYSHLYRLPTTGLRFFTVYGPWGRPDMALFLFTKAILEGTPIDIFNNGEMRRDFTYIDDAVEAVLRLIDLIPPFATIKPGGITTLSANLAPYSIYNVGTHRPVDLLHLIQVLESCLGRTAVKNMLPLQPGDVLDTYADVSDLQSATDFAPHTPIELGVRCFVEWYRGFYTGSTAYHSTNAANNS